MCSFLSMRPQFNCGHMQNGVSFNFSVPFSTICLLDWWNAKKWLSSYSYIFAWLHVFCLHNSFLTRTKLLRFRIASFCDHEYYREWQNDYNWFCFTEMDQIDCVWKFVWQQRLDGDVLCKRQIFETCFIIISITLYHCQRHAIGNLVISAPLRSPKPRKMNDSSCFLYWSHFWCDSPIDPYYQFFSSSGLKLLCLTSSFIPNSIK